MTHWNVEDVDVNAIADKLGTSQQKVAAMINSARRSPRAYNQLILGGANAGQIPPWITRPDDGVASPTAGVASQPVTGEKIPSTPAGERVTAPVTGETPPPGAGGPEPPAGAPLAPLSGGEARDTGDQRTLGAGHRLGSVYDGVRLQSERLSKLGIIRDQGGRYLKATTNPDGSPGFVEVDPVEVERDIIQDVGTKISEAAVSDLNLHMRTVLRKIGLNPTVFMSYAWACGARKTPTSKPPFITPNR